MRVPQFAGLQGVVSQAVTIFQEQQALSLQVLWPDLDCSSQRMLTVTRQKKFIFHERHDVNIVGGKRKRKKQNIQLPGMKTVDQGLAQIFTDKQREFRVLVAHLLQ